MYFCPTYRVVWCCVSGFGFEMKSVVEIFDTLGKRLAEFGRDEASCRVMAQAMADNEWFSESDIRYAVEAIRQEMLDGERITEWLSHYPAPANHTPKRVAVIMAGNIPLVGFFDLMCVIASGNIPCVKPSSKDRVLECYIEELLLDIEPALRIERYEESGNYDAVIATGGDSANLYFRNRFKGVPALLRGSRHSVAVLSGNESSEELEGLSRDVFTYSGLGCRSVSLVFVPKEYRLVLPVHKMCRAYHNNYIQHRALLTMTNRAFEESGEALFVRGEADFPSRLSQINIAEYSDVAEVRAWLAENDERLQCVVAAERLHGRCVAFGRAQHPTLTDYADEKDTMAFLYSV